MFKSWWSKKQILNRRQLYLHSPDFFSLSVNRTDFLHGQHEDLVYCKLCWSPSSCRRKHKHFLCLCSTNNQVGKKKNPESAPWNKPRPLTSVITKIQSFTHRILVNICAWFEVETTFQTVPHKLVNAVQATELVSDHVTGRQSHVYLLVDLLHLSLGALLL